MILNDLILDKLSDKVGQDVRTSAGATVLQLDIQTVTGENISVNTVKRLVGVLDSEVEPRLSTLNLIARFLGYPDWSVLELDSKMEGSGFGRKDIFIEMAALEQGVLVEICWKPDRRVLIRHDGEGRYTVLESDNGKLRPGDILSLSRLAVGFPFVADTVFRGGDSLGCYRAADGAGIQRLDVKKVDK